MLCVGTLGLFKLKLQRHPLHGDPAQKPMDYGFIALLFIIGASGLALWALRGHAQMPAALAIHLGSVMALFATLPYSKFAHGIYRTAALLRHAVEKRQPNHLGLGGD
jgi:citrate/tricarballylate utilization protein